MTINTTVRCDGGLIAREENKVDPVRPELEKKRIIVGPTELAQIITSLEGLIFLGGLVAKKKTSSSPHSWLFLG
jgi:hypothetical protein